MALKSLDPESSTLPVIPSNIHPWLRAVVVLGFLSFVSSVTLLIILTYRLIQWRIKSKRTNQFVILIFNLLWADIQQSLAFLLNIEWLRLDSVVIENPACFAQGWLVSTGDLGSGVWCFAIGLHTFASVILDYRLKPRYFFQAIVALWIFIYGVSAIGVGMYKEDLYVRSGIWCWIHHDLKDLRLWTHYVWIFIFEFGNVIIYAIIYAILLQRIRSGYYTAEKAMRVKAISNLMVAYPVVYVICTLPLASARMAAMSGKPPSLPRLCLSGAMITSNGWLDVLLYTLTRRIMIFSDEPPPDDNGIETFAAFWASTPKRFGGICTVEAGDQPGRKHRRGSVMLPTVNDSSDDLYSVGNNDIKLVTTTHIFSEPAQPADFEEMEAGARNMRPRSPVGRWSEESSNMKDLKLAHIPV
ncbi:G protein-coupled glucose receptor regulating Gpa2-domain-containing protein [Massariosphaeria phaeospora]|uniref:G protein-coupled glucose receptor regulating Gpa2-domain-containing protein n=1 Tax=Massariosphaeria phaeospora TaxID=100035 RepID=A0A7C8M7D5_9PLEO|nr:G protein-coupled glucose receptor regulating Gpa2-domain-containing protein [Massariosphaeria phaeospora]